jgi:hypothetical protein
VNQVRFLIDECMKRAVAASLHRAEPAIEVYRVGQPGLPTLGASDSELLAFCEDQELVLVSQDRKSMPEHIARHQMSGRNTFGVLLVSPDCTFREMIDDLVLVWTATERAEWVNVLQYLPIGRS